MAVCSYLKPDNTRCKAQPMRGEHWCWAHHPEHAEERKRQGSKGGKRGGRGRKRVELSSIKNQLQDLADSVLDGSVERADAAVASQILNVLLRAISVELDAKEKLEWEPRLQALEAAEEARKGEHIWGA
jgi:hypothetical protein